MIDNTAVKSFIDKQHVRCDIVMRYVDLVSEIGELGKELLKESSYGKAPLRLSPAIKDEMGDCIFALLALCAEMDVDPSEVLDHALNKYESRFLETGGIGSGA